MKGIAEGKLEWVLGSRMGLITQKGKKNVWMEECARRESFAGGSVGAKVRLMGRGGCLPVRGSGTMKWKYQVDLSGCGQVETDEHVLFECNLDGQEWERWRAIIKRLKDGMCEYEVMKGYHVECNEIEKETMRYLRVLWNSRDMKDWEIVDWNDCDCGNDNDKVKEMNEDVKNNEGSLLTCIITA